MTKPRMDLTGQRYGRLTVFKEAIAPLGSKDRWWACVCDCGKPKDVRMNQLRIGRTTSCGCLQKERTSESSSLDLTNKVFDRLTALKRDGLDKKGQVLWLCLCQCGKMKKISATNLNRGIAKSCGCLKSDRGHELRQHLEEEHRKDGVMVPTLKRKKNNNNTTGIKGVTVLRAKNGQDRYQSWIGINRKTIYLGTYNTIEEAAEVRQKAEEKYHHPYLEDSNDK